MSKASSAAVRSFWEQNPLCAARIPHPQGSREFFAAFDQMREAIDSPAQAARIHEFHDFRGLKVLEVGCGNGYVLSRYAQHGAEVFGIDISSPAVWLSRQRFAHMGLKGTVQEGDAEHLPFADNVFDCVCSMGVLHHVPDTVRALSEIYRVLKPNGRLIVMFYHRHSALYQINFRLKSWITGKSRHLLLQEYDGVGNPKGEAYSRRGLACLLADFQDVNMQLRHLRGHMIFPRIGKFIPQILLKPLEKWWGFNLYAKARKPAQMAWKRAA